MDGRNAFNNFIKWRDFTAGYFVDFRMAFDGGVRQFLVGPVANVHKPDVVIFAVESSENRLVEPLEVVDANELRSGQPLFQVVTISFSTLFLGKRALNSGGRQSAVGGAKMKLANHHPPTFQRLYLPK